MNRIYALEWAVHFLSKQRTELYEKYCSGVAQMKNVLDTKSRLQSLALPKFQKDAA